MHQACILTKSISNRVGFTRPQVAQLTMNKECVIMSQAYRSSLARRHKQIHVYLDILHEHVSLGFSPSSTCAVNVHTGTMKWFPCAPFHDDP